MMRTFNPNKKIKIQIDAPINPVDGYTIYDISGKTINNKVITRSAEDSDIEDILSAHDFFKFEHEAEYIFTVAASKLTDKFQYLYS